LDDTPAQKQRGERDTPDYDLPGQTAIAQILELTIRLALESKSDEAVFNRSHTTHSPVGPILQRYAEYQRQVLRLRSKPDIAHLANNIRKVAASHNIPVAHLVHQANPSHEVDDNGENGRKWYQT